MSASKRPARFLLPALVLLLLATLRLIRFPATVRIDLLNPRLVFSYFTLVAATDIVGKIVHAVA